MTQSGGIYDEFQRNFEKMNQLYREYHNEYLKNLGKANEIYKELSRTVKGWMDETYKQYFEDMQSISQQWFNFFEAISQYRTTTERTNG